MRRLKHLRPLIFIVLVAVAAMGVVIGTGTSPQLGLDLQGGVSVVLQPTTDAADDALSETVAIIRNRVDALGVAEPEIVRQGNSVIVQLPGVKNQQRALDLVGDTAELRFRPVLSVLPASIEDLLESTSTTVAGETTTTLDGETSTTAAGDTTTSAPVEGQSAGRAAMPFQDAATTTEAPTDTTPTTVAPIDPTGGLDYTSRDDDLAENEVVLPEYNGDDIVATYNLGPSLATGEIVSKANATLNPSGQWTVQLEIKGGSGIEAFNAAAAACFGRTEVCPTSQLAIVLDSRVVSAPTIERPSFERDQIQISGAFTGREAKDLALKLRYGSLPVNLEPQTVQTVSATLGEDSLRAGLIAGLIGLALVAIYMLVYYRALGLVVVLGLIVWSALNYATICWLSESQGLALSLAGVTGLVISVGVTVDSYVVYFERLKDEVALGRTLRSSIERSFKRAFRTILAANLTSFIGAILLYWLTVGPVRGFAFTLALATFFDVVVAWFFIRPMVEVLGRSRLFTEHPVFGVARGLTGKAVKDGGTRRRSIWARLYHGETSIDFVGRFNRWLLLSGVCILAGLVSLGVRGLNLGIDFEGGVVWEVPAGEVSVAEAQEAMDSQGITEATVQTLESDDGVTLRVESEALDADVAREVSAKLAELTGSDIEDVNLTSVGPSWGDEISEKALRALIVFLVVVTIYISFRFELRMALPTLAALIHDVLITVGVYSIFGFEVTPATVIAVLTILGFSIYDGIVVFDKVEENLNQVTSAGEGTTYSTMVNRSLNEVLMRSLNTSITAVFPVLSLLVLGSWILGASTLEEFGLALLIGLISGAYSSLYIATPLHAWMKEREPKFKAIKEKVAAKRPSDKALATAGATAAAAPESSKPSRGWGAARATAPDPAPAVPGTGEPAPDGRAEVASSEPAANPAPAPRPTPSGSPAIPPRPRKKGKRR